MSSRQETRNLFTPHTEERKIEIYERGQRIAREIERIELEKARLNEMYDKLVALMAGVNGIYSDVECLILLDEPEPGKKTIVRMDTHETVEVEDMTDADRQTDLFDADESETDEEPENDDEPIVEGDPALVIPINAEPADA
jgi:hypothetical protein